MIGTVFWALFVIILFIIYEPYRFGQWISRVKMGMKFSDPIEFDKLIKNQKSRERLAKDRRKGIE